MLSFQIFAFQTESTVFKLTRANLRERHVSKANTRGASAMHVKPSFF